MSRHLIGIYQTREAAAQAVDELHRAGFTRDQISILMSEATYGQHFVVYDRTKSAEVGAVGAFTGGALGALAGSLVAVASLAIPGVGFVVTGPIVAALAGAGAGGATGGLIGALIGAGIPDEEAKLVEDEVKDGGILVGVVAADRKEVDRAKQTYARTGAVSFT